MTSRTDHRANDPNHDDIVSSVITRPWSTEDVLNNQPPADTAHPRPVAPAPVVRVSRTYTTSHIEQLVTQRYRRIPLVSVAETRDAHIRTLSTSAAPGEPLRLGSRRRRQWIAHAQETAAWLAVIVAVLLIVQVLT